MTESIFIHSEAAVSSQVRRFAGRYFTWRLGTMNTLMATIMNTVLSILAQRGELYFLKGALLYSITEMISCC